MVDSEEFWGPGYPAIAADPRPPSRERVRAWEARYGVRLPPILAAALSVQDGGCVRGTDLVLYPLDQIERLGTVQYRFGVEERLQEQLVLDYSAGGEPQVLRAMDDSGGALVPMPGVASFAELLRVMRQERDVHARQDRDR